MKEENTKEVTFDQMKQASEYVNGYLKLTGQRPSDYPETKEEVPDYWPDDVKRAWDTANLFWEQNEGADF